MLKPLKLTYKFAKIACLNREYKLKCNNKIIFLQINSANNIVTIVYIESVAYWKFALYPICLFNLYFLRFDMMLSIRMIAKKLLHDLITPETKQNYAFQIL